MTNDEKGCIIDKLNTARPVGQAVKTLASHAENMGSIPVRVTNENKGTPKGVPFVFVATPSGSNPLKTLCVLNMGIAARGIICTDYAYCDVCTYHLLARQDTDFVGMRICRSEIEEHALQAESAQIFVQRNSCTCLPLAAIQHLISVFSSACTVYLLARQYTAIAVCTLKYHVKDTPSGCLSFFEKVRKYDNKSCQNRCFFAYL